METVRVLDRPEDFKKYGIKQTGLEAWEDGRRDSPEPGHGEIWYFDCSFEDGSTLVLGFRPKSLDHIMQPEDNPNVAINYTNKDGETFFDYRMCSIEESSFSKEKCDLTLGAHYLKGNNWDEYDVKVVPEEPSALVVDGKPSEDHSASVDLHFTAESKPFRPGTGIIDVGEGFYYNFICITRMQVSGHIHINGEDKEVSGAAYYNHQWFNISPAIAFHHWVWGRQNIGEYSVLIYDMVTRKSTGLVQIPLFTIDVLQGNRIFENTSGDTMSFEILDTYIEKVSGKEYPCAIRYTFEGEDMKITYTIRNPQEIGIMYVYGDAPEPVRKQYDAMGIKPSYTRNLADTELTIETKADHKTIHGRMLYEFNFPGKELREN